MNLHDKSIGTLMHMSIFVWALCSRQQQSISFAETGEGTRKSVSCFEMEINVIDGLGLDEGAKGTEHSM